MRWLKFRLCCTSGSSVHHDKKNNAKLNKHACAMCAMILICACSFYFIFGPFSKTFPLSHTAGINAELVVATHKSGESQALRRLWWAVSSRTGLVKHLFACFIFRGIAGLFFSKPECSQVLLVVNLQGMQCTCRHAEREGVSRAWLNQTSLFTCIWPLKIHCSCRHRGLDRKICP